MKNYIIILKHIYPVSTHHLKMSTISDMIQDSITAANTKATTFELLDLVEFVYGDAKNINTTNMTPDELRAKCMKELDFIVAMSMY